MAENKKSFLLYCDIIHTVKKLTDEQAGKLFKHTLSYVNDEDPSMDDILLDLVFEPIKQQLKRDLKHWESVTEKRKEAGRIGGLKSGEVRKNEANEANALMVKQNEANEAVTVTVNDIVTVSVKDINKKKEGNDFLAKIISEFQAVYFEIYQTEYVVMNKGKERSAAGKLIKLYKEKYPESKSEETIVGLHGFFEKCCTVPDDWIQKNMSLSIIVSKFNEIKILIKNGSNKKVRSVASRSNEIESIVSAVFQSKGLQ